MNCFKHSRLGLWTTWISSFKATESDAATQQRMIVDEAQNSIKSKAFRQERNESKADLKNEYIG